MMPVGGYGYPAPGPMGHGPAYGYSAPGPMGHGPTWPEPVYPAYDYGYPAQYPQAGGYPAPEMEAYYAMEPVPQPQPQPNYDYVIRVPMPNDEPVPRSAGPLMVPQAPPKRLPRPPQRYEVHNGHDEMPEPAPDYHGEIVYPRGEFLGTEVIELEEEILIEEPRAPPSFVPPPADYFERAQRIKRCAKLETQPISQYRVRREDLLREQLHDSINNREQEAVERIGQRVAKMLVTPQKKRGQPVTEVFQIPRRLITGEPAKQPEYIAMQMTPDGKLAPLPGGGQVLTSVHGQLQQGAVLPGNLLQARPQPLQQVQLRPPTLAALPPQQPVGRVLQPAMVNQQPQVKLQQPVTTSIKSGGVIQPQQTEVNILKFGTPVINTLPPAGNIPARAFHSSAGLA